MTRKAIFISIDGMTDQLGQSQVLPYLAGLSASGFSVEIVSAEKKLNFEKNFEQVNAITKAANITWNYNFYESSIPVVSQRKNFKRLKKLTEERILANNKNVFLHCRSYLPGLIGLFFKRKLNIPFIFDMRGFWADERIDGNIWSLKNPIHKRLYSFFKKKEKEMLLAADEVVTLTINAKKEIVSWPLPKQPNIHVIPCCADVQHFVIQEKQKIVELKERLGIPYANFVVGYLGSLGTWYMQNEMLDFFKEVLKIKPDATFFFVTNDKKEDVIAAANVRGIASEHLVIKAASRKEVPLFISTFDVGLFFIKPLYSKKGSSPTKLAELMACGVPVIANAGVGDVDKIINSGSAGIVIEEFTSDQYKKAINAIEPYLQKDKYLYRQVAEEQFSLSKGIQSYSKIYSTFQK
ncbi:MAG: glycosyltransferase [Bacteroidota bacterium]|nr:glycosyltransferase [Bacteroidota bacterium]